jgi:multiple sugar transport system ATP-binding protein
MDFQMTDAQSSVSVRGLTLSFGAVNVLRSLDLEIMPGEFLVLLGPSGCGKSTLLNCIAGLLDVSGGQIFISGKNVTWEEPKDRGIGMVFQSYALYPQMTVENNLSFGLRVAGVKKDEIARRVARASEILQIEPLLKRKPANLSGGQRQRVAIGRALVRDVEVFLFDEPLSNLDAKLRSELRVEIKRLHQRLKNTMIYVTHDQIEAMTLADRIAIMRDGVIQQLDTPHNIYNKPVNLFVAGFIGSPSMNFLKGTIRANGSTSFEGPHGVKLPLTGTPDAWNGRPAIYGVRPEHFVIADDGAEAEVQVVEPTGSETQVVAKIGGEDIIAVFRERHQFRPGDKIRLKPDPRLIHLFDEATGKRLEN